MYRTAGEHAHHYTTDAVGHVYDTEYICVILSIKHLLVYVVCSYAQTVVKIKVSYIFKYYNFAKHYH